MWGGLIFKYPLREGALIGVFILFSPHIGRIKCRRSLGSPSTTAEKARAPPLHVLFFSCPPTPPPSVPFFHSMYSSNIHTPLIATAHLRPSPPAPCSEFSFPWFFASNHADAPLALPDGSLVPPPPPASLLFHSKMASAPEPLVCGCIFRLVVVCVAHGFGTFFSAPRHGTPVSSSGSLIGGARRF